MLRSSWLPVVAAVCVGPLCAQEGGIEVFAAETLFESGYRVSLTGLYTNRGDLFQGSSETGNATGRSYKEDRTVLGVDYGLDRNATLSVLVPFVDRELQTGTQLQSSSGLGDVAVLGKYRFWRERGRGTSFSWSAIGGIEVPTGSTNETLGGMLLKSSAQVGKGSWNPFLATSISAEFDRAKIGATVFYKVNTEGAQQLQDGDFFSAKISAGYRFLQYKYPGPTFGTSLSLQWRQEGRAELGGVSDPDSGAKQLLLTPALSISPAPNIDFNIQARIPIYQDYNGTQLGRDVQFIVAFGLRF